MKFVDSNGVSTMWNRIKEHVSDAVSVKVDRQNGKGLSSEDFTSDLKDKLEDSHSVCAYTSTDEMDASTDGRIDDLAVAGGKVWKRWREGDEWKKLTVRNLAVGTSKDWVSGSVGQYGHNVGQLQDTYDTSERYYVRVFAKFTTTGDTPTSLRLFAQNGSDVVRNQKDVVAGTEYRLSAVYKPNGANENPYIRIYPIPNDAISGVTTSSKGCVVIKLSDYPELLTLLAEQGITTDAQICAWLDTYVPYIADGEEWVIGGDATQLLKSNGWTGKVVDNGNGSYAVEGSSVNASQGYRYQAIASGSTDVFYASATLRRDEGTGDIGIGIANRRKAVAVTTGEAQRHYHIGTQATGSGYIYFEYFRASKTDTITHWETGLHGYPVDKNSPLALNLTTSGWLAMLSLYLRTTDLTVIGAWINEHVEPFTGSMPFPASAWEKVSSLVSDVYFADEPSVTIVDGEVVEVTGRAVSKDTPAVVIDSYRNGTSWYRLWSDNFLEQGGYITATSGSPISLFKQYGNTSYRIFTALIRNNGYNLMVTINTRNIESWVPYLSNGSSWNSGEIFWRAEGYVSKENA